ncbi:hypothetical protein GYA13_05075 [Candidatus Kuenenbacteria bacterium]|nr:hypothetical protein [Candidatus Kuenenbacteria bacterium]
MKKNINNQIDRLSARTLILGALLLVVIVGYFVGRGEDGAKEDRGNNMSGGVVMTIDSPENYQEPMIIKTFGQMLQISPLGAMAAEREDLPDGTIFYREAYPNTDVEQIKYPNKLKESLILKSANHPDSFEYRIDTQNFSWEFDGEGNIIISRKNELAESMPSSDGGNISAKRMKQYSQDQSKSFKIPKPFMVEQGRNEKGKVSAEIIGDRLILTPDKEWIKNHNYPIVVDPTVEKLPRIVEEVAEKRSYNSLTFLNDDGSYTTMAHVGHINYKEEGGEFQIVDTTLIETGEGWKQDRASYKSKFPRYADEWMEFENMYESGGAAFSMKPLASHTEGQLIRDESDEWHDKKVVYKDAFGDGNDLELIAGNIAMFKYVKLNQKPANLSQDMEFNFELELKPGEKLIINNKEWNGADEIITSEQIGITIANGNTSYLRKFTVWDNQDKSESISIKISKQNGKIYFTKILPKEFLASADYPVYTDASVSYYTGAVDGSVYTNTYTSWATARGAATGDGVSNTRTDREYARSEFADPVYEIFRLFLPFNSSALDDGATISSAILNLYGGYIRTADNDGNDYSVVVQTSQASPSALTTADYDQVGSTAGSATYDTSVLVEGGWNALILNTTGLSWISKTGYTLLGIREGHDMINDPPTGKITHEYAISESAYDPYLSITYNVTPTATTVTDTPDPTNPGRSVSFIYDWNDDAGDYIKIKICKTNSLTNQNCDGGYWASSTDFTTADPAVVVYDVVGDDAGQTRDYWAFACDNSGACTTGTPGTFSVNAQSTVPNIKVRGGLRVR